MVVWISIFVGECFSEGSLKFLLLRRLTALVCLAEPATHPSRTILHDSLNWQTASSYHAGFMPHLPNARAAHGKCTNTHEQWVGLDSWSATLPVSQARMWPFQENHYFSSACNTEAVGIAHRALRCL